MWTLAIRSPSYPGWSPQLPSPDTLKRSPSSTPAGISILMVLLSLTLPFPWHSSHGSVMILPVPPHSLQGLTFIIWPSIVLLTCFTCPVPLHVGQVFGSTPGFDFFPLHVGQILLLRILTSFSTPLKASSSVILTSVYMSDPLWGPVGPPLLCEPPPNPNMSNMFPISKPWNMSSKFTFW